MPSLPGKAIYALSIGKKIDPVSQLEAFGQSEILFPSFICVSETVLLREDLADLMPMVNEANAISEELDKKVILLPTHIALCLGWPVLISSSGKSVSPATTSVNYFDFNLAIRQHQHRLHTQS